MTMYKIDPKPQKSLRQLERDAIAFANQGRWDAAAEANQDALALSADNVEALNRLGRALSELGRYTDARETFQKVLRLSRNNPIARKNLERIANLQDEPRLFLERALADGHLRLDTSSKSEKIVYVAADRAERWSDPEEKVRAEFYAELIYRYGYSPDRIGVEITVPDRSPNDFADLVVFRDDELKRPLAVIECKKDAISDAEFAQAVEQAWGNGNAAKFRAAYVGVVAGGTRRFLDCDDKKFGALERDKNVIADLPANYDKPPASKPVSGLAPRLFLEESGKTCLTDVTALGGARQLSRLAPGEALALERSGSAVVVRVPKGDVIGRLTPKLAARLARLLQGGNRYAVAVASIAGGKLSVLIREVYQHPSLTGVVSFPSSTEGADIYADDVEVVEVVDDEGPEPEPGPAPGAWPAAQAGDEKDREGDGEAEESGAAARKSDDDDDEDEDEM